MQEQKQILRLRRRMTTKKQKLDAKTKTIGGSARIDCYQPRVCMSWDSSMAAAARPFMVPVTDSQASATILGWLKWVGAVTMARAGETGSARSFGSVLTSGGA